MNLAIFNQLYMIPSTNVHTLSVVWSSFIHQMAPTSMVQEVMSRRVWGWCQCMEVTCSKGTSYSLVQALAVGYRYIILATMPSVRASQKTQPYDVNRCSYCVLCDRQKLQCICARLHRPMLNNCRPYCSRCHKNISNKIEKKKTFSLQLNIYQSDAI